MKPKADSPIPGPFPTKWRKGDINKLKRGIVSMLDEQTIAELERLGALKPDWLRDRAIRRRWKELRDGKMRPGDAIQKLVEEFHLGDKRIDAIVYETQRNGGGPKSD